MKPYITSAISLLNLVRQQTDTIGVGISFGKDSLSVLDLCSKVFPKIYGYYLFRVRNISLIEDWRQYVKQRYSVDVVMIPHFDLSRCYKNGVLRPHTEQAASVPKITMKDVEVYFKSYTGVEWLAYGWRRNDSFSRAIIMKQTAGYDEKNKRIFPLRSFKKSDVLEYLKDNNIPRPPSLGREEQGGLDFHPEAIRTLKEQYPEDYKRWDTDFPFSGLQLLANQVDNYDKNFA